MHCHLERSAAVPVRHRRWVNNVARMAQNVSNTSSSSRATTIVTRTMLGTAAKRASNETWRGVA